MATLLCNHPRNLALLTHLVNPRILDFEESLFVSLMLVVLLALSIAALGTAWRSAPMRPRNQLTGRRWWLIIWASRFKFFVRLRIAIGTPIAAQIRTLVNSAI